MITSVSSCQWLLANGKMKVGAVLGLVTIAACLPAITQAKQDYALRFQPDSKARIDHQPTLNLTKGYSMECWIKADQEQPEQLFRFLISKNQGGTGYGMLLKLTYEFQATGLADVKWPFQRETWTHLAFSHNGATAKFYVNGELISTTKPTEAMLNNGDPLWIGSSPFVGNPGGQPSSFKGLIDEVRVWKYPRSQSQIKRYMRRSISGKMRNLVVNLSCNEGKGTQSANRTRLTGPLHFMKSVDWVSAPPLRDR